MGRAREIVRIHGSLLETRIETTDTKTTRSKTVQQRLDLLGKRPYDLFHLFR